MHGHAQTALTQTERVRELTRAIVALPRIARMEQVNAHFEHARRLAVEREADIAGSVFALALLLLLSAAGSVIARLRRAAEQQRNCGGRYQLQAHADAAVEPANALALEGRVRFVCSRATPDVAATDVLASAHTAATTAR